MGPVAKCATGWVAPVPLDGAPMPSLSSPPTSVVPDIDAV